MRRKVIAGAFFALLALTAWGISLWVEERQRQQAFPAAKAKDLLHPARRLIQSPTRLVRALRLRPGDTVLEVGPGPGYFTPDAARALQPGGLLICCDLQRDMLCALRDRLAETAALVELVVGEAAHLPFRDGVLDGVFMVAVLGEVPEGERAVLEIARVLRAGGIGSFSETVNDPDYVRLPVLRRMCAAAGLEPVDRQRQLLGYVARFRRAL